MDHCGGCADGPGGWLVARGNSDNSTTVNFCRVRKKKWYLLVSAVLKLAIRILLMHCKVGKAERIYFLFHALICCVLHCQSFEFVMPQKYIEHYLCKQVSTHAQTHPCLLEIRQMNVSFMTYVHDIPCTISFRTNADIVLLQLNSLMDEDSLMDIAVRFG